MAKDDKKQYMLTVKNLLQPAFVICVAVLVLFAGGMSFAIKKFGVYLQKEPLPLKKSFELLDQEKLLPYKVVNKHKIQNKEIVESLGTEDYIEWVLEDTQVASGSPVAKCSLFITYYELPDKVPHVPEECYTGVGYQKLTSESFSVEINSEGFEKTIPITHLVFGEKDSGLWFSAAKVPILYFFSVNNIYANSRDEARGALNKNLFGKYSYFSKVEWKFFNIKYGKRVYPDKQETIEASKKLLGVLLPILEDQYWPQL